MKIQSMFNNNTFLTDDLKSDKTVFLFSVMVTCIASIGYTMYVLLTHNVNVREWASYYIDMPGSGILICLFFPAMAYYAFQIARFCLYYSLGYDNAYTTHTHERHFVTFMVGPIADIFKSLIFAAAGLIGCMIGNLIIQEISSSYENAKTISVVILLVILVILVFIPVIIKAMKAVRKKNLDKRESYRQLGGKE